MFNNSTSLRTQSSKIYAVGLLFHVIQISVHMHKKRDEMKFKIQWLNIGPKKKMMAMSLKD